MNISAALTALLVAATITLSGCQGETQLAAAAREVEQRLAWVETAKPAAMLAQDISAGQHRFLSVCGYACVVPSVGAITAERCYPTAAVQPIEGTSDVRLSTRHSALVERAAEVAAEYNLLAARSLSERGLGQCPQGANWDAAFRELHALALSVRPSLAEADFSLLPNEPTFTLNLPPQLLTPAFTQSACAVIRANKLPPSARIAMRDGQATQGTSPVLMCQAASAA
jgi:hypothetical protein